MRILPQHLKKNPYKILFVHFFTLLPLSLASFTVFSTLPFCDKCAFSLPDIRIISCHQYQTLTGIRFCKWATFETYGIFCLLRCYLVHSFFDSCFFSSSFLLAALSYFPLMRKVLLCSRWICHLSVANRLIVLLFPLSFYKFFHCWSFFFWYFFFIPHFYETEALSSAREQRVYFSLSFF